MELGTNAALYETALMHDLLEVEAERFFKSQERNLAYILDIGDLHSLFRKICDLVGGEEAMENINQLFRQSFMLITPMVVFLQEFTNVLLENLTYRDKETSRLIFQFILDENL
jgi:hypothetical protein